MTNRRTLFGFAGLVLALVVGAAIVIPNYLRTRMADGGNLVTGALRTIEIAAISYESTYSNGFPPSLEALDGNFGGPTTCDHAQLIDQMLASGIKADYRITYAPVFSTKAKHPKLSREATANGCTSAGGSGFKVNADPLGTTKPGQHHFYTDETGVMRFEIDKPATASSPKLDGED